MEIDQMLKAVDGAEYQPSQRAKELLQVQLQRAKTTYC
jgi:hypothetical protein